MRGCRALTCVINKVRLLADREPRALADLDAFLGAILTAPGDIVLRAMLQTGAKAVADA